MRGGVEATKGVSIRDTEEVIRNEVIKEVVKETNNSEATCRYITTRVRVVGAEHSLQATGNATRDDTVNTSRMELLSGDTSSSTMSPAVALERSRLERTMTSIPMEFRNPEYSNSGGGMATRVTQPTMQLTQPALQQVGVNTTQALMQPMGGYPQTTTMYTPIQGQLYQGYTQPNSLGVAQQRFRMVREFGKALNQFYNKPVLSKQDDPSELFKAVKRVLQLTQVPDGIAVSAIQFKMGPDYADWNRTTVPMLHLTQQGVFQIYEKLFWEETQANNAKLQELNVEYNTMALKEGESVDELLKRILRVEEMFFAKIGKIQKSDYDANTHLYNCINRSKDFRRQELLDLMDDNEYVRMKYKDVCDILLRRDRGRLMRAGQNTISNYNNKQARQSSQGTGGGYLNKEDVQPVARGSIQRQVQVQQPGRDETDAWQPRTVNSGGNTSHRRYNDDVASGANAQQMGREQESEETRGSRGFMQWRPQQGETACRYHSNGAHPHEGRDYTTWRQFYNKPEKPFPDEEYVNRYRLGLNQYGSKLKEAREKTRAQFEQGPQVPYHQEQRLQQQQQPPQSHSQPWGGAKPQHKKGDGTYPQPGNQDHMQVHNVIAVEVDNTPAVSEQHHPIPVTQGTRVTGGKKNAMH